MSIADLSQASGVHRNTLTRVEQGGEARTSTIRRIARALGVAPATLVDREPEGD